MWLALLGPVHHLKRLIVHYQNFQTDKSRLQIRCVFFVCFFFFRQKDVDKFQENLFWCSLEVPQKKKKKMLWVLIKSTFLRHRSCLPYKKKSGKLSKCLQVHLSAYHYYPKYSDHIFLNFDNGNLSKKCWQNGKQCSPWSNWFSSSLMGHF